MNTIRCSMLPAWDDCSRRTGARQYWRMLEAKGFALTPQLSSVGAAVGTAVHTAAGHYLKARLEGRDTPSPEECEQAALDSFNRTILNGAIWDATTPNPMVALQQISRMWRAYLPAIAKARPVIVEKELRGALGAEGDNSSWEISGHLDLYDEDDDLDDLKTGVPDRSYQAQLGGYLLILEANGYKPKRASRSFVKRVRLSNPQPAVVREFYSLEDCKRVAWRAIQEIRRNMDEFIRTGDPYALRANPSSMMCSEKYCPVWGTTFCTIHKPKEADPPPETGETHQFMQPVKGAKGI